MQLRTYHALAIATFLGIGQSCVFVNSHDFSCEDYDSSPKGQPADYPLAGGGNLGTVSVHPPQLCEAQEKHIRVERAQGKRQVGDSARPGVPATGCLELPANPQDFSQCPIIAPYAILDEASRQLQERGLSINGIGGVACLSSGQAQKPLSSMGVTDWGHVQEAVTIVAQVLERYELQGSVMVGVRGIECAYPKHR